MKNGKERIMEYIRLYRESLFFRKIFRYYIIIFCFLMFCFSIIMTYNINKNYKNKIVELNEKTQKQAVSVADSLLMDIYQFMFSEVQNDADITALMFASEFNTQTSSLSKKVLDRTADYRNVIESVYIVSFRGGFVCSTYGTYQNIDMFIDQDIINFLEERSPSQSNILFFPREVSGENQLHSIDKKVLSLVFYSNESGAFVVNISYDEIESMLTGEIVSESSQDIILNKSGKVVLHYEEDEWGKDYSEHELSTFVEQQKADSGTVPYKYNGVSYYLTYSKNMETGWLFLTLSRNLWLDTTNLLLMKVVAFSILFIIIGILISGILSVLLYHPVMKLKEVISPYGEEENGSVDEFTQISTSYRNIFREKSRLEKDLHIYRGAQKQKLLLELLVKDFISVSPVDNSLVKCGLHLEGPGYVVCMFEFSFEQSVEAEERRLLQYALENIASEFFEEYCTVEWAVTGENRVVCIINLVSNEEREEQNRWIELVLSQTQAKMVEFFDAYMLCGIGNAVDTLEDISGSSIQAEMALQHSLVQESMGIIFYSELSLISASEQVYPYKIEEQLMASLKAAEETEIVKALGEFFDRISNFYYNYIILFVLQLNLKLEQMELFYGIMDGNKERFNERSFQNKKLSHIQKRFQERCLHIGREAAESRNAKAEKSELINQVKEMVKNEIYDTNLTVEYLAQHVHLSVNYLRRVFKESCGMSLSAYINGEKLKLICHLLITSDMTVEEISDKLGFSAKSYFYTYFKKHMNCTPNQYRISNHEN